MRILGGIFEIFLDDDSTSFFLVDEKRTERPSFEVCEAKVTHYF